MQPFFEDYLLNLNELHDEILNALKDLPPAALDWSPDAGINSINVLVTHTVGSQRYWIGEVVAGDPANRDREAEFQVHGLEKDTLVQRLIDSLAYVRTALEGLTLEELSSPRDLPRGGRSVAWVLGHALKHTATHVGHVQLTRQLWEMYGKNEPAS
jgi:uncharacterized damage-inducible protein DinB